MTDDEFQRACRFILLGVVGTLTFLLAAGVFG